MISCDLCAVLEGRSSPYKVKHLKLFEYILLIPKFFIWFISLFVSNCFAIIFSRKVGLDYIFESHVMWIS